MPEKKKLSNRQQRSLRIQQIVLTVIGVLIILSMVISMLVN